MLEPPEVDEGTLIAALESAYGLDVTELRFLPLGADPNTAVFRIVVGDGSPYFLKLRRGPFPEATVTIPHWLATAGGLGQHLIAPLPTRTTGGLWIELPPFTLTLAPFVNGRSGWGVPLSEPQWVAFGRALGLLHTTPLPTALTQTLPQESYSPQWRNQVAGFLGQITEQQTFGDAVAADLAALLRREYAIIHHMVTRAEALAQSLQQQSLDICLCHGDIHAANLLIDPHDHLYLVDWDTLVMAPKERDLMFIGSGIADWGDDHEAEWFYSGYGQTSINGAALTYYRYERIVQDVAVTCEQLLTTTEGGADRLIALQQLASQFGPASISAIAHATDTRFHRA